ncbi:MAG TPA: glycosyltransferase [Alphaproteobacteria bacterium]|nr:glycosyltransferase [Alphaproteobacteria bacterium]
MRTGFLATAWIAHDGNRRPEPESDRESGGGTVIWPILEWMAAAPFALLAVLSLNLLALCAALPLTAGRQWRRQVVAKLPADLPRVLIQLPVYNEPDVVARALRAAAALDWPRDRLRIQLLDDSTDLTSDVAAALAAAFSEQGFDIRHVRRRDRQGYKAGALANGLTQDDSPFIAIFDADFVAPADFLKRAMSALLTDETFAFVQARWEHLNRLENPLTIAQAMMIDAHFMIEQRARSRTRLMLPFNGTCGIWRRAAIDSAGGWAGDTLCEDLDLSLRARLAGWKAIFLETIAVPGELPPTLTAWRSQQFRWTKGFVQVGRKLFAKVWRSDLPFLAKLGFTLQISQPLCYPLTALSLLSTFLLLLDPDQGTSELSRCGGTAALLGLGASALCLGTAAFSLRRGRWFRFPLAIVTIILLNAGLLVSNSRAVVEGLIGTKSPFVRTPKCGAYQAGAAEKVGPSGASELLLALVVGSAFAFESGWASPLFSLSVAGLVIMGAGLARERRIQAARKATFWRLTNRIGDQSAE